MLSSFMKRYPEVRVVLDISNRPVDAVAEEIDLAIRIGPLEDSEYIARRLATIELWLCASPSYLRERGTPKSIPDLFGHNFVSRADQVLHWKFWSANGTPRGGGLTRNRHP